MKYTHKKTGVVIETDAKIKGELWVAEKPAKKEDKPQKESKKK